MEPQSKLMLGERTVRHRLSADADQRDYARVVLPATEVEAHQVWLATRGMDVYERMAFDRL